MDKKSWGKKQQQFEMANGYILRNRTILGEETHPLWPLNNGFSSVCQFGGITSMFFQQSLTIIKIDTEGRGLAKHMRQQRAGENRLKLKLILNVKRNYAISFCSYCKTIPKFFNQFLDVPSSRSLPKHFFSMNTPASSTFGALLGMATGTVLFSDALNTPTQHNTTLQYTHTHHVSLP